jgi:hypothetical protein
MPKPQSFRSLPPLHSLLEVRGARHEMARLYCAMKSGQLDPILGGRLVHALNSLLASHRDHIVEDQLAAAEALLGEIERGASNSNGHVSPPASNH